LVLANSTYRTLHRERRVMDVQRAVRFLLLAKASALVGAIVAGGYLGFALDFVGQLNVTLPEQRVIRSVCAAISAVLLVVGGLLLERACRVPKDKDE
jgi:sulfite exporter TauE/SafE